MYRHFASIATVLVFALCAGSAICAEMTVPGAGIGSAAASESEAARDEAPAATGVHGGAAARSVEAHAHLQPDSASEARTDGARANVGADGGSSEFTPKTRHRGPWQSLLPGVMK